MKRLVLTSYLLIFAIECSSFSQYGEIPQRIVGGEETEIEDVPYHAAIVLTRNTTHCGAAILTESIVITAAHCVGNIPDFQWVRAGTNKDNHSEENGQMVLIDRVVTYEYPHWGLDYDIALCFLATPLELDGVTAAAIDLPAQDQEIPDGTLGIITGWGYLEENGETVETLRKATIATVNRELCYDILFDNSTLMVTDRMFCAGDLENGGIDFCAYDSGGPMVVGSQLIGIMSWGRGCGRPGYPGVYASIPSLVDWIKDRAGL